VGGWEEKASTQTGVEYQRQIDYNDQGKTAPPEGGHVVRKATRNYITAITLFILGLFQAVSGFIMWLALPRGGGQGGGWGGGGNTATFWSLSRHTWVDIHSWVAVALVVIIIIHLVWHWKWITYVTKSYFKRRYNLIVN